MPTDILLTLKIRSIEALCMNWLTESHPFYLDDTIHSIIPELDEYTFEIEERTNTKGIQFVDVKG